MSDHRCIAPIDDDAQQLCGAHATTVRTVDGLVCHLCSAHAAELDTEQREESMTTSKHFNIGLEKLDGTRTQSGIRYYAHEINAYVTVREEDVARLGAMLEAGEPDAYSLWCAETVEVARTQPTVYLTVGRGYVSEVSEVAGARDYDVTLEIGSQRHGGWITLWPIAGHGMGPGSAPIDGWVSADLLLAIRRADLPRDVERAIVVAMAGRNSGLVYCGEVAS
jgi:hypothetical protein